MRLFSRLLKLYPLHGDATPRENFFTEIIAYVLDTSPDTLYAWLASLNLFSARDYNRVKITTQAPFKAPEQHELSSRPDIEIKLYDEHGCDLIFIESKIDSAEGHHQLQRYAKILAVQPGIRDRALLYITHHYDPKDEREILAGILDTPVQFKQLRWHQVYHFLQKRPHTDLLEEILEFMKESKMAQETQFTPVNMMTLVNFGDALQLMDATMSDDVCTRFETVVGGTIRKTPTTKLKWLQSNAYWIVAELNRNWHCGFGYNLRHGKTTGYPRVSFWIEVFPHAPRREEIIEAMKRIRDNHHWGDYKLEEKGTHSHIYSSMSLEYLLSSEDHVAAIKEFFLKKIDEFALIKKEYPDLPWKQTSAGKSVEEEEEYSAGG